jgi:glycosyltransferase involved in cell wall biosynthesis
MMTGNRGYSSRVLQDVLGVPNRKIDLIPHGIPDLPFVEPEVYKDSFSIAGKAVLLAFGLLSTNKGFENVIRALPRILSGHENLIYIIAGATHPHVKAREGARYRYQLQALPCSFRTGLSDSSRHESYCALNTTMAAACIAPGDFRDISADK